MKRYNIDRFSKDDVFGGRLIAPMRQWLQSHNMETKNYDYNTDMAIITHYLQNKDYPEGQLYREEAFLLMEKYYRAKCSYLANYSEMLFDDIAKEAPKNYCKRFTF